MPHPDYKEEIEKQYPIKKGEISLESDLKEERIIGAEWFRDTIHLPEIEEKDKEIAELKAEVSRLNTLINSPEINDFIEGVKIEAAHQTEKWGKQEDHPPHHYILIFTKLLGKLSVCIWDRDVDKFKHHLITLSAAAHNIHRQIDNDSTEVNYYFNNKPFLNKPNQ